MEDIVNCKTCNKEIPEEDANYLDDSPYCDKCYPEAEVNYPGFDDEDDEDDEGDDDDGD